MFLLVGTAIVSIAATLFYVPVSSPQRLELPSLCESYAFLVAILVGVKIYHFLLPSSLTIDVMFYMLGGLLYISFEEIFLGPLPIYS